METKDKTAEGLLKSKVDELSQHNGSYASYKHTDQEWKDMMIEAMEEHASNQTASLRKEIEERELSYQLRHAADVRAIKIWQEKTSKKMTLPDQADLCVFLMGLIEERDKEIERLKGALNKLGLMALCAPGCHGRCCECPSDVINDALNPPPPSDHSQESWTPGPIPPSDHW